MIRLLARRPLARPLLALTLAACVTGCDTTFGERPIGGGDWEGLHTHIHAPAEQAWPIVAATLEELGAGKAIPHPKGAESAVRVTWDGSVGDGGDGQPGRWVKLAVDPARSYASVLSAYAMNDLGLAQDMVRELVAALRQEGIEVDEPVYRTAHEVDHQRIEAQRPYADGFWGAPEADHHHHDGGDHDHGHGDHHGDDHHGDDHQGGDHHGDAH